MEVIHPLEPIYDKNSKVLILGTMPSVTSRQVGFYYGHPKNRFWKTLSKVYKEEIGESKLEKIAFLKKHHIALFDVLKSCTLDASKDSSIKNPVPNDLLPILKNTNIKVIFTTGRKAYQLYQKYCEAKTGIQAIYLPSTSPCNCPKGIDEELEKAYSQMREYTEK